MMEGTLKRRDGKLYVLYSYTEDNEPARRHLWWAVRELRGMGGERPEAGDIATSEGGGMWRTRARATLRPTGSVSTGSGSTQAEVVERSDVSPPSVRGKELRWQGGRWEKLLAKGWFPAGEGKARNETQTAAPTKTKTKRQLDAEINKALSGANPHDLGPHLFRRAKWNLYDKAGRLVGDVFAYSAEEALRLAGGPGVESARLPGLGGR